MKQIFGISLGYSFLALGVVGLVVPFLQGFLFLAIGLVILSRHTVWARRLLDWVQWRYPRLYNMIERAEAVSHRWWLGCTSRLRRVRASASKA